MKKYFKYAFAILASVAMALCVASCSKDDDENDGGSNPANNGGDNSSNIGASYNDLFGKMWVVSQEKYNWIDEETGKKETATLTSQAQIEDDGLAIDIGFVMIFEKVWESSRFLYVKMYRMVGHSEYWSDYLYGFIDKTDNNWYGCGNMVYEESDLLSVIGMLKEEKMTFKLKGVSSSKLVWFMDEGDGDTCESTYTPQSSWHGKTMQQIKESSIYSDDRRDYD